VFAIKLGSTYPLFSLGLGGLALVAFRGCPMCWSTGLVGTIANTFKARSNAGARVLTRVSDHQGPEGVETLCFTCLARSDEQTDGSTQ